MATELFDEKTFPIPDALSPDCQHRIRLCIKNMRETRRLLARPDDAAKEMLFCRPQNPNAVLARIQYDVFA